MTNITRHIYLLSEHNHNFITQLKNVKAIKGGVHIGMSHQTSNELITHIIAY